MHGEREGPCVPGRGGKEHELGEEVGPGDGGEHADDGRDGVADVDAGGDSELLEDGEEVERVSLERGVAGEVEVVRVGRAGAHGVEEDDAVVGDEVRHQVLPHRLVRAEAVRQDDHPAPPLPHHPQVVSLLHDPHGFGSIWENASASASPSFALFSRLLLLTGWEGGSGKWMGGGGFKQ